MSWLTDIARPEIQALRAYRPARWQPGMVRLHANELPWRAAADPTIAGLNRYPEPYPFDLEAKLAALYDVQPDCLIAGRGTDEMIDLLLRSYIRANQDSVVVTPPTFGMYQVAAQIQGAEVLSVPLRAEDGFVLDEAAVLRAVRPSTRLVFVCTPNNPTGNLQPQDSLLRLAQALQGRALLVVDEAYLEFADSPTIARHLSATPALAVLRTLSKAHGLAGARCGALLANPEVVGLLRKVIQPYALTQLTIEAVGNALAPESLASSQQRVREVISERTRVARGLEVLPSVQHVWPSDANFVLVEFCDAAAALERAASAGLLLRDFRGVGGLEGALRITIGTPEQNDRLLASLT